MKRVTLILTICIMLVMLVGCDTSDVKDHAADIAQSDNEYIKIVKNGVNDNYPDMRHLMIFSAVPHGNILKEVRKNRMMKKINQRMAKKNMMLLNLRDIVLMMMKM